MSNSIAIINKSAPYGSSHATESLDLAMIAGTFGQDISVYFFGDAVFQLIEQQKPQTKGVKNLSKVIKSLIFFDIENIYVCQKSMQERSIQLSELCVDATPLSNDDLKASINKHSCIMVF